MEKERPVTYDSFFDRPEFEAFMFWHQFAGYIKHIQKLADYLLQNKHKQQLVVGCLGMINVEIDAIKALLYDTYGLVLDIDPSHSKCVEDKDADHLADLYFWSLDYQKEIEIIINNSTKISNKLEEELNDKGSYQHIDVISQSMLSIFSLITHAMQMPVMLLNDFDSFLREFRKSEIGERVVAGWRKDYLLSQEQLLLQLKEIKKYRPWVDKCKLLHEGKIEKRELFVDLTIPGIQHNKELYKTNSWLSIFSLMSILEEYEKKHESMNLDVYVKNAVNEYLENNTASDADIDELFENSQTPKIEKGKSDSAIDADKLPEDFQTPEAKQLMKNLSDAGLLTTDWQPVNLSIAERGYLADEISSRLKIKSKWKVMGALWNENSETLRQGKNKAVEQTKTRTFIEKLKGILD